ncbi:heme peroxidase, partial [Mycena galopus ATCC 62051]
LLACVATAKAYIWPSPQLDALESVRYDQIGFNSHAFAIFVQPCTASFSAIPGRSDVGDWILTAYHDMATYNITDGTGGMDGSIRLPEEQARPEARNGFQNTFDQLAIQVSRYVSCMRPARRLEALILDLIFLDIFAIGAITAIENCGGPEIAFRGGRIDAGVANAPGVPEPQQDLDSHIAAFARQGFTQTEMIGLVACGHTFGGVEQTPFPDIVAPTNGSSDTVSHCDTTFVQFDNNVATEYIAGTTQNPFVVGVNDTANSDKRIFGSDGNVTIASFVLCFPSTGARSWLYKFAASPELYVSTCADLFARMLNTVPSGVQLSDMITPLPVKPDNILITLLGDTLTFSGQVRFWNTTEDASRTVTLLWDDHVGGMNNVSLPFAGVSTATAGRYSAVWYTINPIPLDAAAGITSMSFSADGVLEDQGGLGFAVQDGVVFSETSCQTQEPLWRLDVAVRNNANVTRVYLEQSVTDSVGRVSVNETDIAPPAQPAAANAAYSIWSLNI